jgi:cobalt-zinc-cadmium efflux system protein
MDTEHSHDKALTCACLVVELVGGFVAHSLALLSDAAHRFTDTTALASAAHLIHRDEA